ncbi:hypothetical protein HU200_048121 [Digitaria exilis]|uniref:Homeobox domain-containing protein n=1 Tax=Digitaria exilis TaxID=1010633 RepID=A0A835EAY5_9POAL|nr:hypothetical protein HU200_048121 [Digitaria exilis]
MGIAAPPSQPSQTTTYVVSHPTNKSTPAISGRPATAASSMSHSQGFHQGSGGGVFGYSSDGFDRPADSSSQDHHHHVAQQSRRDKLRVQGFDPAAAGAGHGLLPIDGDEHGEPSGAAMYDHHAAAAGASNMLSEMFNFPAPPSAGPSATELLASQMNANYHRFGLRPGVAGGGLSGDAGWFGAAGRAGGLVLGGANMGSLGETSSPKQQQGSSSGMAGLATDPAAAMQLFLMNPQQQQQQQSRSSPTSPSDVQHQHQHHEAFQAFGSNAAATFGGGVVEGQGLSLSLSPSLQQLEMAKQAEELRVRDGVLYFNRQQQQQLPMALHGGGQVGGALGQQQQLHVGYGPAGVAGVLRNSKYTRAAQELLEEFCSVGRGQIKGGGGRGGRGASASNPSKGGASSSGAAQSPTSASKQEPPQLSPADRFEHQRKKAKLISMLDEARPPSLPSSFLSCMHGMAWHGHGCECVFADAIAAKASSDWMEAALKLPEVSCSRGGRCGREPADTSVAVMIQKRARGRYPSDADKHLLARQTGLSRNQVSNWFINARVRLWKPMIEEMYQQECRELEGSSGAGAGGGPESGNDPSATDDTHSPTTTGAAGQLAQHHQHGGVAPPGGVMPHKPDPGAAGPSAADAAFVGIDPVELLGGDAHVGGGADDLYGRFEPGVRMRYGPTGTGAAAGDVSLTLGLQHAGAGNAGPDGTGRFSLRDYSGC